MSSIKAGEKPVVRAQCILGFRNDGRDVWLELMNSSAIKQH